MMPSCKKVEKLRRTHLVSWQWKNSRRHNPPVERHNESGWNLEYGMYRVKWFDGDASQRLLDVTFDNEVDELDTEGAY